MGEKEADININTRISNINTIIFEFDKHLKDLVRLEETLQPLNYKINSQTLSYNTHIQGIEDIVTYHFLLKISEIISSEWFKLLNFSILSGEYYFVKEECELRELKKLLSKLSENIGFIRDYILKYSIIYFDISYYKSLQKYFHLNLKENIFSYIDSLNEMIGKYISLIKYTQIQNNQKTVKSEIEINQLLNNNIPDGNSDNLKRYQLAIYPNIILAEIDHDFHAGSDMENKLNMLISFLNKEKLKKVVGKNFILYKILYDKANFLLYKVILRKYKNSDTDGNIGESTNFINRLTEIKMNITYYSEFIDEINKVYLNGVI